MVCSILLAACGSTDNGPFTTSIAPGLTPRLTADDAVRISRDFLDAQAQWLAVPDMHIPAKITGVWAVVASRARTLDGCIPPEPSGLVVWVTKGQGDYMDLTNYPWSGMLIQADAADPSLRACHDNGKAGTIVIDDATGQILGVFPDNPFDIRPTPEPN